MNDIEGIRDYLISDELRRIQTLPVDVLRQELVVFRTGKIEAMSDSELLRQCQLKK